MNTKNSLYALMFVLILLIITVAALLDVQTPRTKEQLSRFDSCPAIVDSFKEARDSSRYGYLQMEDLAVAKTSGTMALETDFSQTNVQVEGVDEADIVKTDGRFIYATLDNKLVIARAYPEDQAEILSATDLSSDEEGFVPYEIFINNNKLLIFGNSYQRGGETTTIIGDGVVDKEIYPYRTFYATTVSLFDVSNKEKPVLIKSWDFEGNYVSSRKIGSNVYFVINSYPYVLDQPEQIVPLHRENTANNVNDYSPIVKCTDVEYLDPLQAQSFVTVASLSMEDPELSTRVIVGPGQNIYASLENLYIAQTVYEPEISTTSASDATVAVSLDSYRSTYQQYTKVHKFELNNGEVEFIASGEVPGTILNQFSMDEHEKYFRIATTQGHVSRTGSDSSNNIYVLDEDLSIVGKIEDIAPGERIYSSRFMGDRAYLVTFKKVDPFFVIDLSDAENPKILGKLKIPGYSDYLHPYDEDHVIGIGKEAVEAEEGNFAWYQGLKMALFDVSDVENPVELHKVVIGDRGTDSFALQDHKAFLFDKERNLLVIPITLAEIEDKENAPSYSYGEFVFQGAYVYELTLEDGFDLRGRITHYEDDEAFLKSGYYFDGDSSIMRSLYIDDILYTISNHKIQLNSLRDLTKLKELVI